MKELFFKPCSELEEVISSFYCFQTGTDMQKTERCVMPNLEMMLILNFGSSFKISFNEKKWLPQPVEKFALVGPLRNSLNYEVLSLSEVIVVNFILDGCYRLFKLNLTAFNGNAVTNANDLHQIFTLAELWNMLNSYRELSDKVEKLQEYLCTTIQPSEAKKLGLLFNESSSFKVVINTLYKVPRTRSVTNRAVQVSFKKYFGYSVKEKIRYERFKNLVAHLLSSDISKVKWVEIIELFEYYDYSHLCKDFRKFVLNTPGRFLKDAANFCVPGTMQQ